MSDPAASRLVLVIAPWRTRSAAEDRDRLDIERAILEGGSFPIFAPYLLQCHLDDEDPDERDLALVASAELTHAIAKAGASCVVVGDRTTEGMQSDIEVWLRAGGVAPQRVGLDGDPTSTPVDREAAP